MEEGIWLFIVAVVGLAMVLMCVGNQEVRRSFLEALKVLERALNNHLKLLVSLSCFTLFLGFLERVSQA